MTNQNDALETKPPALERVPQAAKRMGVSVSQAYREIAAGRLFPLVKLGERMSAVPTASVDAWINDRIAAATATHARPGG